MALGPERNIHSLAQYSSPACPKTESAKRDRRSWRLFYAIDPFDGVEYRFSAAPHG